MTTFEKKFVSLPTETQKNRIMPEISKFFGIIVNLYWRDHNPPHIHFTW